jgi:hypothetical protein
MSKKRIVKIKKADSIVFDDLESMLPSNRLIEVEVDWKTFHPFKWHYSEYSSYAIPDLIVEKDLFVDYLNKNNISLDELEGIKKKDLDNNEQLYY